MGDNLKHLIKPMKEFIMVTESEVNEFYKKMEKARDAGEKYAVIETTRMKNFLLDSEIAVMETQKSNNPDKYWIDVGNDNKYYINWRV